MPSRYDHIRTAEELVREVADMGLSQTPDDIRRVEDIFFDTPYHEIVALARGEGDVSSKALYTILFTIWPWYMALEFFCHSTLAAIAPIKASGTKKLEAWFAAQSLL